MKRLQHVAAVGPVVVQLGYSGRPTHCLVDVVPQDEPANDFGEWHRFAVPGDRPTAILVTEPDFDKHSEKYCIKTQYKGTSHGTSKTRSKRFSFIYASNPWFDKKNASGGPISLSGSIFPPVADLVLSFWPEARAYFSDRPFRP